MRRFCSTYVKQGHAPHKALEQLFADEVTAFIRYEAPGQAVQSKQLLL